jgi:hypothetical protein
VEGEWKRTRTCCVLPDMLCLHLVQQPAQCASSCSVSCSCQAGLRCRLVPHSADVLVSDSGVWSAVVQFVRRQTHVHLCMCCDFNSNADNRMPGAALCGRWTALQHAADTGAIVHSMGQTSSVCVDTVVVCVGGGRSLTCSMSQTPHRLCAAQVCCTFCCE